MFGNVTALLVRLHVTRKYRNGSMQHTFSRHAAWHLMTRELDLNLSGNEVYSKKS